MTSSIQQIEAALARVQFPQGKRQSGGRTPLGNKKSGGSSCSFNLTHEFEQTALDAQAAAKLAQVTPPQFCKPLSRIGAGVGSPGGPRQKSETSMARVASKPIKPRVGPSYNLAELAAEASAEVTSAAGALANPAPGTRPTKAADDSCPVAPHAGAKNSKAEASTEMLDAIPAPPDPEAISSDSAVTEVSTEAVTEEKMLPTDDADPSEIQTLRPQVRPIAESSRPGLPRSKAPKFTSHRNGSNPMLPLNLLQDIGKEVVQWQTKLKGVHDEIQALYSEGPIINAWLESAAGIKAEAAELESGPRLSGQYHVCGLDKNGQVWRKVCPMEQLPQVTVAIARHQKLRQLLSQKKSLDGRLQGLSKALTMLRSGLRAY